MCHTINYLYVLLLFFTVHVPQITTADTALITEKPAVIVMGSGQSRTKKSQEEENYNSGHQTGPLSQSKIPSQPVSSSLVHSHWSRNVEARLSLVESFPSDACANYPYAIKNQLGHPKPPTGSLWHKDSWLPCTERSYYYYKYLHNFLLTYSYYSMQGKVLLLLL